MGFKQISKLAKMLHRQEGRESSFLLQKYFLYTFFFGTALTFFSVLFSLDVQRWSKPNPSILIDPHTWHSFYSNAQGSECSPSSRLSKKCPAHPQNPSLWTSTDGRFKENDKLIRRPKKDFWIGTSIPPEKIAQAKSNLANQLILGWIYGSFEVWVNGDYIVAEKPIARDPTIVTLPLSYLQSTAPLKIAIQIHPDSELGTPDMLAAPWKEGFATAEEVAAFKSEAGFWKRSRPFALFLLNFLISTLFFMFWYANKQKQEYFYLAVYGMICAIVQIRLMDIFRGAATALTTEVLDTFLHCAEAGFGLLLAFSFARSRKEIFRYGIPLFLFVPVPLQLARIYFKRMDFLLNMYLYKWVVPSAYFIGAFVCLLQAVYLYREKFTLLTKPRIIRLVLFSLGMIAMGLLYMAQSHEWVSFLSKIIFSRFSHFAIVFLFGAMAMIEYKEERHLLEKSPVSRYHRMKKMPEKLSGALLAVDIKNSEKLFRLSAQSGEAGKIVETCLSHLWASVIACGGTVLQTDGDGLRAFFDKQENAAPALAALRATDLMEKNLMVFCSQLQDQGILEAGTCVPFRAGISCGEIKPSWQEMQGMRVATWTETGSRNPFVESARMLEIERKISTPVEKSAVIVMDEYAHALDKGALAGSWLFERRGVMGKHDHIYLVSAYLPEQGEVKQALSTKQVA